MLNVGSKGPDILNYSLMGNDTGGVSHRVFIKIKLYMQYYLPTEKIFVIISPLIVYCFNIRKLQDIILVIFSIFLLFHLSYAANSLFGNILRQGFATIIFIFLYHFLPRFAIFSSIIHPGMLVVHVLQKNFNRTLTSALLNANNLILIVFVFLLIFTLLPDRLEIVLSRDILDDYPGAFFTFALLWLRFMLYSDISFKNPFNICILIFMLILLLLTGEFGQRIAISLIFILDVNFIRNNLDNRSLYFTLVPILLMEAFFRYYIVGNFWGIL